MGRSPQRDDFNRLVSDWMAKYMTNYKVSFDEFRISSNGQVTATVSWNEMSGWRAVLKQAWYVALDDGFIDGKKVYDVARTVYPAIAQKPYYNTTPEAQMFAAVAEVVTLHVKAFLASYGRTN